MMDLIDVLERSLNPLEVVELLNSITFNQENIDSYAINHNICPKCYSDLKLNIWEEPREHFGYMTSETMSELRCYSCNWSLD